MFSPRGPIGIEVTARTINAVQVGAGSGRPRIVAAMSVPRTGGGRPLTPAEAQDLVSVLERQQFRGRAVVIAVPADDLMIDVFRVHATRSNEPVETLASDELARAHRCQPGSFEFECTWVPGDAPTVLAVGCTHTRAEAILDVFEGPGLRVEALDAMPLALLRATSPVLEQMSEPTVILHLDWGGVCMVLVHEGAVIYHRQLPDLGVDQLIAKIASSVDGDGEVATHVFHEVGLAAPPEEGALRPELLTEARSAMTAFVGKVRDEARRSLDYVRHEFDRSGVGRLFVVGEGARMPGLADSLQQALGVDVRGLAVSNVVACAGGLDTICASPLLYGALGLALYPRK